MAFRITFNPLEGTFDFVNNGDVIGPNSATDNAIARYDGTTGKIIQNSNATIQDGGAVVSPGHITNKIISDNITIESNHVMLTSGFSIELDGELVIEPDGELVVI